MFELKPKQAARFHGWRTARLLEFKKAHPDYEEEDCAPMSPFVWTFQQGSIGAYIKVAFEPTGQVLDLSLDDDGEFLKP
jgi:hypothetical protein